MRRRRMLIRGAGLLLATVLVAPETHAQAPVAYPIDRVNREVLSDTTFIIQGYVTAVSECPPCPPNAVCPPCAPPTIVVSSRKRPMSATDALTTRDVRLATNMLSGFTIGNYYRFTVRRPSRTEPERTRRVFELVAFAAASQTGTRLQRITDAERTRGVRAAIDARLGKDFVLDRVPAGATLDLAFTYLTTEGAENVFDVLTGVPVVYATTLDVSDGRRTVTAFVFATRPDFSGDFVYAVSREDGAWPVFLHTPN